MLYVLAVMGRDCGLRFVFAFSFFSLRVILLTIISREFTADISDNGKGGIAVYAVRFFLGSEIASL